MRLFFGLGETSQTRGPALALCCAEEKLWYAALLHKRCSVCVCVCCASGAERDTETEGGRESESARATERKEKTCERRNASTRACKSAGAVEYLGSGVGTLARVAMGPND